MSSAKQRQLTGWVHCTTEIGPVEKHRQRRSNSTEAKGAFNVKLNLDVTEWNIKKKLMMKWCQSRSVVNSFGFRLTYAPGRVARRLHRTWSRAPYTHVLYKKCWHDVINDAVGYNINQMSFISSWIDRGIFYSTPTVWHSRPPFDILTMSYRKDILVLVRPLFLYHHWRDWLLYSIAILWKEDGGLNFWNIDNVLVNSKRKQTNDPSENGYCPCSSDLYTKCNRTFTYKKKFLHEDKCSIDSSSSSPSSEMRRKRYRKKTVKSSKEKFAKRRVARLSPFSKQPLLCWQTKTQTVYRWTQSAPWCVLSCVSVNIFCIYAANVRYHRMKTRI